MSSPPRRRRVALASVAAVTAAASAGLVWAAWSTSRSPDLVGETRLRLLAAEVSDAVQLAWQRWSASPEPFADPAAFAWAAGDPASSAGGPEEDGGRVSAFDALSSEVEREAHEDRDPVRALRTLEEALELAATPLERARGRRRAVQLAVLSGQPEAARRHWRATLAETDGAECGEDGVSLLLWTALAAAPALGDEERAEAARLLSERWAQGRLALPAEPARVERGAAGVRVVLPGLLDDLASALGELGTAPPVPLDLARRRRAAVEEAWSGAPEWPAVAGAVGWSAEGDLVLAARCDAAGRGVGRLFARPALVSLLESRLPARAGVPDAFAVDLAGDGELPAVLPPTPLPGTDLAYVLRHEDPGAVVAAEGRRTRRTALGLLALALFTALAGGLGVAALRRERRLGELKAEFVAGVSHELRTPLASILLMAENLESGRVRDEASRQRYHASLLREAQRLRRLVDDVLDFARLDRGEAPRIAVEEVAAGELWESVVAGAEELAARRGATVSAERGPLPETLEVDAEALRRAVLNLVDNALRHSGSHAVELSARANGSLVLRVADRGRGVPEGLRERIFEPFRQIDGVPAPARGAGLGLSIVREIARAHGGTARARGRAQGPGVAFEIELPLAGGSSERENAGRG